MGSVLSGWGQGREVDRDSGDSQKLEGDSDHPLLAGTSAGKRITFLKNSLSYSKYYVRCLKHFTLLYLHSPRR